MKKAVVLVSFLVVSLISFVEDPFIQLIRLFENYTLSYPNEKVYLHTDKPYYTAGENIWFKSYAVLGSPETPDTLSVPLYVELIDSQTEKVIDQRVLRLENGFASGDFRLADTLRTGFYQLRAYTNWMRNFGESAFFKKDFRVFEAGSLNVPSVTKNPSINFQFFPEGGDLISGIKNRLAFKATDDQGKGVFARGYILGSLKDTVARFETRHQGMGYIYFKPNASETYEARVTVNNIIEISPKVPEILPSGFTITVDNLSRAEAVRVFINKSADLPTAEIGLVAQSKGRIYFSGKAKIKENTLFIEIPKKNLPAGVTQLTLIDDTGKPHCERLIYLQDKEPVSAVFSAQKKEFDSRELVELKLKITNSEGLPVQGNFSVVVSDTNQVKHKPDEENIYSYFNLSSEVNGTVEKPNQYFQDKDSYSTINLDLLLLTQGWRRFTWRELAAGNLPTPRNFVERGLQIRGEITRSDGKIINKPIAISLMIKDLKNDVAFLTADADPNGSFLFPDLEIRDSVKVLIQAVAGRNRRNTSVFVDSISSPKVQIVKVPYAALEFENNDLAEYLRRTKDALELEQKIRMDKAILLEEVVVKGKKESDYRDGRVLYSTSDATIQVAGNSNFNGYINVIDLLRGRVAGVQVFGGMMDPTVVIRGAANFSGFVEPLFLLDGMPVDKSTILSISVMDVDRIDVLKGPSAAIYGSRGGGGVISVLTKQGNEDFDWNQEAAPGIITFTKQGYYTARSFYSPRYDLDLPENLRPDYRSTVYWNPTVITDEKGEATVSFYTTDATNTQFKVQLEGLNYAGKPVVGNWAIDVR
jgi:TonB-dependent SusC/RagA subfamily outer membrane receptor